VDELDGFDGVVALQYHKRVDRRLGTTATSATLTARQCRQLGVNQILILYINRWQKPSAYIKVKGQKWCIAPYKKTIAELWSVTCRMESHSVTCTRHKWTCLALTPDRDRLILIYLPRGTAGWVDLTRRPKWWCNLAVNKLRPIIVTARQRPRLVLGLVTVFRQVKHFGT